MGLREALADYVHAIGNYLLGRDMDVIGSPDGRRFEAGGPRRRPVGAGGRRRQRGRSRRGDRGEEDGLAEAVEEAHRQWVAARQYFDQVVEPDLIDYAVFSIGAAEKRYMYLLDEARRRGVEVDPLTIRG